MAIHFNSVKCPECGADLQIEQTREFAFCSYCGAKVMISNDNEKVLRTIDEARIRQAETDRIIRLRELEMEEKNRISKKNQIIVWISITLALLLMGIIGYSVDNFGMEMCMLLAINTGLWGGIIIFTADKKKTKTVMGTDGIRITAPMMDCVDRPYNNAVILYKNVGFKNINAIPLHDLGRINQKLEGKVESITINGSDEFEEEEVYPKNANILITYHSR